MVDWGLTFSSFIWLSVKSNVNACAGVLCRCVLQESGILLSSPPVFPFTFILFQQFAQKWYCRWAARTQTGSVPYITLTNLISSKATTRKSRFGSRKSKLYLQQTSFRVIYFPFNSPDKHTGLQKTSRTRKKTLNVTFLWWRESFCGFEMILFFFFFEGENNTYTFLMSCYNCFNCTHNDKNLLR